MHSGGGLTVLKEIIKEVGKFDDLTFILDFRTKERFNYLEKKSTVFWVKPNLVSRFLADLRLVSITDKQSLTVCINGELPLFRSFGKIYLFIHNKLVLLNLNKTFQPLSSKIKIIYQKIKLFIWKKSVNRFYVQTITMKKNLTEWMGIQEDELRDVLFITPFVPILNTKEINEEKKYDLIYVADSALHKNHHRLFESIQILAKKSIFPTLALTISPKDKKMLKTISDLNSKFNTNIINLGVLEHEKIIDAYHESRALIYPSLFESLGMPLVEARQIGLPIIASEMDYVRDVCVPNETFNPYESLSIARAIERFFKHEHTIIKPERAEKFIKHILS